MATASEILDRLGPQADIARELGWPETTLSSWRKSNSIPEWRRPRLLELAAKRGIALSTADFPNREAKQEAA